MHDDRLILDFNPNRIDFNYLRDYFFYSACTEFSSYRASIVNMSIAYKDINIKGIIDTRKEIDRIHLIDFIRNDFCEIYFKKSAKKIADILIQNNFNVSLGSNGIIIKLAENIPSNDELEHRSNEVLKIIQNKIHKKRFYLF